MTSASPTPNAQLSNWLKLREAADAAARSMTLTEAAVRTLAGTDPVRVLDLGTGAGSNLRYLIPRLPSPQRWLVVDRGDDLLADLLARTAPWATARGLSAYADGGRLTISGDTLDCVVETRQMDLGPLADPSIFEGRHLVTASALLDLVSASWLAAVAGHCRQQGAAALFTVSYNGTSQCDPVEPEDALVLDLFNRHQRTDKGLGGPAAGPGATEAARKAFEGEGFRVRTEPSDWTIGPEAREMQRFLVDGWASAASEVQPAAKGAIEGWRQRRLAHLDAGHSRLVVGHCDLVVVPPPAPS